MKQNHVTRRAFALSAIALAALALSSFAPRASAENAAPSLAVKNGDKIAFLGDSITAGGARKNGYVTLVMEALKSEGLDVSSVPAGKSGNRSNDMLARLDADVISKKPQWLLLSCGVNDVWHFKLRLGERTFQGVPLEDDKKNITAIPDNPKPMNYSASTSSYKKNITAIIDKAKAAGIKVMILTATMIGEDPERELNKNLIPYNDFLRQIAKERNCLLADLNTDMQEALKKIPDEKGPAKMFGEPEYKRDIKNKLTVDGCHPNRLGNIMMAKGILRAFGLSEEKIAALK
jgi:lysophospholipase L1-like esterase